MVREFHPEVAMLWLFSSPAEPHRSSCRLGTGARAEGKRSFYTFGITDQSLPRETPSADSTTTPLDQLEKPSPARVPAFPLSFW